jgi:protein SCO1
MRTLISIFLLCFGAAVAAADAAADDYDHDDALAVSQGALGHVVRSQTLRDTDGRSFQLEQLRGKPLVVSMIYTSCHHVCPTITKNLARTIDIANEALGDDAFAAVTIGFDWAVDTPDRMRLYAAERRIDVPNWHFLSGDEATVAGLSADLGFLFYPSAKGFDHLTQTTVVDAEGRVYRQIYGVEIDPPSLVEPLKELVFNTPRQAGVLEHWANTFRLFCTVYDPNSGRYKFDYSIVMTVFVGVLCLAAILLFVISEWRHAR